MSDSIDQQPWGIDTGFESPELAGEVAKLGASAVRITLYWNEVEPVPGRFDWSKPDFQITRASEARLFIYITIWGTPRWANKGKSQNDPPISSTDWVNFLRIVAMRYDRDPWVQAYGIWNEPNLKRFWTGSREEFTSKILSPATQAIKGVDRRLLVCGPDLSHHWTQSSEWNLGTVLQAAPDLDVLTQHIYPDISSDPNGFTNFLDKTIQPLRGNRPVWITETGYDVCGHKANDEKQAGYLQYVLNAQAARSDWWTKIFIYRLWDPSKKCSSGNGFGLTFGVPIMERSSFAVYRDYIAQHATSSDATQTR